MLTTDIEYLRACLAYQPETGLLLWRTRPLAHFRSPRVCAMWNAKYAGKVAGGGNKSGHWSTKIDAVLHQNHRLGWALYYGVWPADQIDHINGDPADNRISNLREATPVINARNRKVSRNNTSGANGVSWHARGRAWLAYIGHGATRKHLGSFASLELAKQARQAAEREVGGYISRCEATIG